MHRLNGLQKSNSTGHVNTTGLVKSNQDFEITPAAILKMQASKSSCDLVGISQQYRSLTLSPDYHFDFTDGNVDGSPSFPVSMVGKRDSNLNCSGPIQSIITPEYGKSDTQFTDADTKCCRTDALRPLIHEIHNMGENNMSSQMAAQKHKELVKQEASIPRKTALSIEEICKRAYDFIYDFDDMEQMPNSNDMLSHATSKQSRNNQNKLDKDTGIKNNAKVSGNKQKTDIQCYLENEIPVKYLAKQYSHTKYSDDNSLPGLNEGKFLTTPTWHKKIPKEQIVSKLLSTFNETTEMLNKDIRDVSALDNNSKQTQSIVQAGTSNINFNNGNNSSSTAITFYAKSNNVSHPLRYPSVTKTVNDLMEKFSEQFEDLKREVANAEKHSPPENLGHGVSYGKLKPGIKYNGTNTKHCIMQKEKQYGPANRLSDTKLVNSTLKSKNRSEICIDENRTISRSAFYKKSNIPKYVHFADNV